MDKNQIKAVLAKLEDKMDNDDLDALQWCKVFTSWKALYDQLKEAEDA